jgi:hypothetical protein
MGGSWIKRETKRALPQTPTATELRLYPACAGCNAAKEMVGRMFGPWPVGGRTSNTTLLNASKILWRLQGVADRLIPHPPSLGPGSPGSAGSLVGWPCDVRQSGHELFDPGGVGNVCDTCDQEFQNATAQARSEARSVDGTRNLPNDPARKHVMMPNASIILRY